MAALTITDISAGGAVAATVNTLTSSDTFTYVNAPQLRMVLTNATGGALTINLDGADTTTFSVDGYGQLDPTTGLDVSVPDGESRAIVLNSRSRYLTGQVTMTGGLNATCIILQG